MMAPTPTSGQGSPAPKTLRVRLAISVAWGALNG